MTKFTRRDFLQAGGALAGLGALGNIGIVRDAHAAGASTTLISVHLTGGNDTLNTVIPYQDPSYYSIRGSLAIPKTQSIAISDKIALHPSLAPLKSLFDKGRMAIIPGVGYPQFDYSHFQAMQIYGSGDPKRSLPFGWLGRGLDASRAGSTTPAPALMGLNVGWDSQLNLLARDFVSPLLPPNPDWYWIPANDDKQFAALAKIIAQPATRRSIIYDQFVRNSRTGLDAYTEVKQAGALTSGVTYPQDYFSQGLQFVAKLLRVDTSVRAVSLTQGSYDTHEYQFDHHAQQLAELAGGLNAFMTDLENHGAADRVIVVIWSEFARRVQPNANQGTDHGAAQAMLLLGKGVKGGIAGAPPSLNAADLVDEGNLKMAVDFRSVYATLLNGWLGVDATAVLGGTWSTLPVLL